MPNLYQWRILLCDLQGNTLSNISNVAYNRKYVETLNSPTSFTFTVDSSHPKIATLHTDGTPYLDYIRRVVTVFRYEPTFNGPQWTQRFAGFVWPIQDTGSEDGTTETQVTAIDPLIMLSKRLARTASGAFTAVKFDTVDGGQILKTLVDRTNDPVIGGGATGLVTTGTFQAIQTASMQWDYKLLSDGLGELTKGFDISVDPLDSRGTNAHGKLNAWVKRGLDRQDALFSWKTYPHTLSELTRTMDPTDAVNVLIGTGSTATGQQLTTVSADRTNAANYMQMEGVASYSDVRDQTHLQQLVASDLYDRRPPQEAISVVPFDGLLPFEDYNTGDYVYTSASPTLRGGVLKRQERLFGHSITISDENDETYEAVTQADS